MHEHLKDYGFKREVPPDHFAHMTDWLLQWRKRDPELSFSLVLIEFKNPSELGNSLGAKYAMDLIRRIGNEIDSVLRTTDIFSRTRVCSFWVLLPKGDPSMVIKKIEPILSAARMDGMDATQLHIRSINIPTDLAGANSCVELYSRMRAPERH